jgi:hypothetical protein
MKREIKFMSKNITTGTGGSSKATGLILLDCPAVRMDSKELADWADKHRTVYGEQFLAGLWMLASLSTPSFTMWSDGVFNNKIE